MLDCMKHDSNALHSFLEKVLNKLKMKYPMLQKCVYFSDGVGSQYKNYKTFTNFSTMNQILAPMLSGISLRPLMGKALVTILEVLSNALLIIRAFDLCKNQLILC